MTAITYRTLQQELASSLQPRFGPDAVREARYILAQAAGLDQAGLITAAPADVPEAIAKAAREIARRRMEGEPLSRIRGSREFYGRDFLLARETLDPRPDSETLILAALEWGRRHGPPETLLDLGTGTGCLLLTLLAEWPQTIGIGVDISRQAVETAQINARRLGIGAGRCQFLQGCWADAIADASIRMVVSNPPYIPSDVILDLEPEVRFFDPILALDGGQDGLMSYKSLVHECSRILTGSGPALFEIGIGQENEVIRLGIESGATQARTHVDSGGITRVVEMHYGDN